MNVRKMKTVMLYASVLIASVVAFHHVKGVTNVLQAQAQPDPTMLVPNLAVRSVVSGLTQPTTMAFVGNNDFFVLEKSTGKVLRVVNGVVQGVVIDLAVNFASERGLLGIALHPDFPINPGVYLYWTCQAPPRLR
jgi:glucose/arabinose dehydrogenase